MQSRLSSSRQSQLDDSDDEGMWSPLQLAAAQGDLLEVQRLLSQSMNPNEPPKGYYGQTALQAASHNGHLAVAAAEGGQIELLRRLLEQGAEVNTPSAKNRGRTALQAAALGGHAEIVDILLRP
ncbi:ankyrin repeat-containing protein [Penicillium maclennaniae]|uniref:ankyrin repeat-containing protein n=1 Tax=Penicillium maclennaniae TaxID=1343394 RepID=UPI0025412289|nr:ankyrin repeat-containing protein [Penicillium maclennaniae]KAJ5676692.1 ankyrin repeat-containing protein [Penicillium maclennaniae]